MNKTPSFLILSLQLQLWKLLMSTSKLSKIEGKTSKVEGKASPEADVNAGSVGVDFANCRLSN